MRLNAPTFIVVALAILLPNGVLADSNPSPCTMPEPDLYKKMVRLCERGTPTFSAVRCHEFLAELAAVETPSLDQAIALAFGRVTTAQLEGNYAAAVADADVIGRRLLKPFVDKTPNDPMLVYAYSRFFIDDWEEHWVLLRRVLTLDPTCSAAAFWLDKSLSRSEEESRRNERLEHLTRAYEHSEGIWKLLFARKKHEWFKSRNPKQAEEFLRQVAVDMALRELPLDAENRASSLEVLCNRNGLLLRLDAPCANAVGSLAARDQLAHAPLGGDVLAAIKSLSASAEGGELGDHGAKYQQMLLDLLGTEPERLRSAEFYVVYSRVLRTTSRDAEVDALRDALALDPHSGEIGLYLTSALKRAGRPSDAIAEVYRHVIANSDGRAIEDGMPANYYVERATKYLRELEADGNGTAE